MRVKELKALFQALTAEYFGGAEVTFTRQSRASKPRTPLVTLTFGNVKRPLHPIVRLIDGEEVMQYPSSVDVRVDLFTNGSAVTDDETGSIVAYDNTAMDDMLSFQDFLNSQYVMKYCYDHDISILFDGNPQDISGVVNDNNYEYRAYLTVLLNFTHIAIGNAGVLNENSIVNSGEYGEEINPQFEQTSAGGGTDYLSHLNTGYFTEVEIEEENNNE